MLTCKEASKLVSESLDRRLPLGLRVALRLHLMMCRLCSRYKRHLVFMRSALRLYSEKIEDGVLFPASLTGDSRRHLISLLGGGR